MLDLILLNENNIPSPSQEKFEEWIFKTIPFILKKIPKDCHEICISIVDKNESAQLNEMYRHKKGPTNILSFAYEALPGISQESLGDLVICAELVESEAKAQHKSAESHWTHLTVHGLLHLIGYDHIEEDEAEIMETLEIEILKELGVGNPYEA